MGWAPARHLTKPPNSPQVLDRLIKACDLSAKSACGIKSIIHDDGITVTEVVIWDTHGHAKAAMEASMHEPTSAALMTILDPESFSCYFGTMIAERLSQQAI